jgi:preprotein translocase subunit SecD
MRRCSCLFAALLLAAGSVHVGAQEKASKTPAKLSNGVYEVLRESATEKEVLPLKDGEVLVVHQFRFLKKEDKQPPRYLVVRSNPDVDLDLAAEPKAVKEGDGVVRILLKLQPKAAAALERLTSQRVGEHVAILIGGEVVTTHTIRTTIKGGDVQITSCAAGAANYLLEQLQARQKDK